MEKELISNNLIFNIEQPLIYNWTGKFEAPTSEWSHLTRTLYDYELMLVTKGTLYIQSNDTKHEVSVGEYIIMPPLTLQRGWKSSDCSFYWLHFAQNEGEIMTYPPECTNDEYRVCLNGQIRTRYLILPMKGTIQAYERLVILFKQLQDCEKRYQDKSYDDFCVTSLLLELKNQIKHSTNDTSKSKDKKQLCDDIIDYIHWHISEPITVLQIANYYGYNPKYLSTLFKKITGNSLKKCIMTEKMEQAKLLLTDTKDTVAQIGYILGFQDNHNFSSCFKKITGLTPLEYRKDFDKHILFHK